MINQPDALRPERKTVVCNCHECSYHGVVVRQWEQMQKPSEAPMEIAMMTPQLARSAQARQEPYPHDAQCCCMPCEEKRFAELGIKLKDVGCSIKSGEKAMSDKVSHKHCVFCGEALPVPRPTNWSTVCTSPDNKTQSDTVGNRHHAFLIGRTSNQSPSITAIGQPQPEHPDLDTMVKAVFVLRAGIKSIKARSEKLKGLYSGTRGLNGADIHLGAIIGMCEQLLKGNSVRVECPLVGCKIIGSHEHKIEGPAQP